jgi:hypothetical protein
MKIQLMNLVEGFNQFDVNKGAAIMKATKKGQKRRGLGKDSRGNSSLERHAKETLQGSPLCQLCRALPNRTICKAVGGAAH